jgi:hypothetical protein
LRVHSRALFCTAVVAAGALAATGTASAHARLTAKYLSLPARGVTPAQALAQSTAATTVPLWSHSATAFGSTYKYQMVGRNPFVKQTNPSVTITTDLVPIKIELLNSSNAVVQTFNPDGPNTACGLSTSPDARTLQSPLFTAYNDVVDSTNIGTVQYESGFMRENFAKYVLASGAINPNYGITLRALNRPAFTVQVPAADWSMYYASTYGQCGGSAAGNMPSININWWDPYVQGTVIPALQAAGDTTSTHMLDLLVANVVMYQGSTSNCCILGYHSGVSTTPGVQYYDTADYDSTALFSGTSDVSAMSHELGEWINDPSGTNPTPAWGHVGQVSGCQHNLEVGDPLSGTTVSIAMPNGLTYHPQELAFLSWFYRQVPSIGLAGWYSSNGTFKSDAGPVCS